MEEEVDLACRWELQRAPETFVGGRTACYEDLEQPLEVREATPKAWEQAKWFWSVRLLAG